MTLFETTIAVLFAQIPSYFVQRYFFKKFLDEKLDGFETKIKKRWYKENVQR